jgi:hypothetical protein
MRLRPPHRILLATLLAVSATLLVMVRAQDLDDEDTAPADGLSNTKRALITRYIEATQILTYYDQVVSDVLDKYRKNFPAVEPAFWQEFKAYHTEPTDLYKRLVPIYAKHFSESDLREVLKFFESPSGRKYTAVLPMLGRETGTVVRKFEEQLNKDIIQQLRNSGY